MVGLTAALVDFGGYASLTRLHPFFRDNYVAVSLGTAGMATLVTYFGNRLFTFSSDVRASVSQYAQHVLVSSSGIFWQNLLLFSFVRIGNFNDILAKLVAVSIIGVFWNFLLAKFWVFRYNKD